MAERPLPDLSLNEMRTLIAISEEGTFTAAAKKLGISQPAVSRQIVRMEQRLGVSLIERDAHHQPFTSAGEQLLSYARSTVANFDCVLTSLRRECYELSGELRLEASTPYRSADWIRKFASRNPEVKVSVLFSDSLSVEEDVLDGTADLGLIGRAPVHGTLLHQPVGEDEVVLAVPSSHPFAGRGEIDLEEIRGQPFVTCIHRESGAAGPVKATLDERGLQMPERQLVMTVQSDYECNQAVAHGIGLAWVTSVLFDGCGIEGVTPVRIRGLRFMRTLHMIHSSKALAAPGRAFLESLPDFEQSSPDVA